MILESAAAAASGLSTEAPAAAPATIFKGFDE
jgi:hypothetical protein